MKIWLLVAVLGVGACYQSNPNLATGIVVCGGANGTCPAGLSCECDNRCHSSPIQCNTGPDGPLPDGAIDGPQGDGPSTYVLTVRAINRDQPTRMFCMAATLSAGSTRLEPSGAAFFGTMFTRTLPAQASYTVALANYQDIMFSYWDASSPCPNKNLASCTFTLAGDLMLDAYFMSDPLVSRSSCTTGH